MEPSPLSPETYKGIINLLQLVLIRECSSAPYMGNYKDGVFATKIMSAQPLKSSLQILIDSSNTNKHEKAFFGKFKDEVDRWLICEGKRNKTTNQDVERMNEISVELSTIVRADCQARLVDRRSHPGKSSRDTVMDEKLNMVPEDSTYAIKDIHEMLVFACRKDDFWNYKGGAFGSSVIMSKPIIPCLQTLINSPLLHEEEKMVFTKTRDRLVSVVKQTCPDPEMLDLADYPGLMQIAFEQDQKVRFFTPEKYIHTSEIPGYSGKDDDISKLLALAHLVLMIGIKDTNYLGGKLKDNAACHMNALLGLSFLSTNDIIPSTHRPAFEAAKSFVNELKEYKDEGSTNLEGTSTLYLDFIQWFNPICALFAMDALARKHHTGNWPRLEITACKEGRTKQKIVCKLGTYVGHPLFPDEKSNIVTADPRHGGPKERIQSEVTTIGNTIYLMQQKTQGWPTDGGLGGSGCIPHIFQ